VSENIILILVGFIVLPLYTVGLRAEGIIGNRPVRVKPIFFHLFVFPGYFPVG
jgi:hypothetical protein